MASKIMASRTMNANVINDHRIEWKTSLFKRLSKHLFAGLQKKWRTSSRARQELWRAYDGSAYAHSMPRCAWRRHGALLMYARDYKPGQHD
jgi:hypothetical protein